MQLPATLLSASILALTLLVLVIVNARARGAKLKAARSGGDEAAAAAELEHRIRVVANFTEYTPLGLVLIASLELSPTPRLIVHGLAAMLVLGRLLHGWGYSRSAGESFGRMAGTALTWLMLLLGGLVGLYAALIGF